MTGRSEDADQYLVTRVQRKLLDRFQAGEIDLRTLLLGTSADGWYLTKTDGDFSQPLELEQQWGSLTETGFLPDEGFLLQESVEISD